MSGVQVTRQENSFTVTKGSTEYTVEDKNKNGKIDKSDIWTCVNGETLNTDEMAEAMGLSLKKEKMTTEEMVEYNNFLEKQKAKDTQDEQRVAQQQPQPQKKMSTGRKILNYTMMGLQGILGTASSIIGGFFGFGGMGNNWAFNGSTNDWGVRLNSGYTNMALNSSNMFGNGNYGMGMGGFDLSQVLAMNNKQNQSIMEALNEANEKAEAKKTEKEETAEKQDGIDQISKLYEIAQGEDKNLICEDNRDLIKGLYDPLSEKYTEEDLAKIKTIKQYPQIPLDAIAGENGDNGKLTDKMASKINEILKKYVAVEGNESKEQDILSVKNKESIEDILSKAKEGKLTTEDIEKIKTILKNPTDKAEEE